MESKAYKLKIRAVDIRVSDAIKSGKKKIETRAWTEKYGKIKEGDTIIFICGKDKFTKQIISVQNFRSISSLLKKYRPGQIDPAAKTEAELRKIYYSFPNYREKLKKHGLIAWKLK